MFEELAKHPYILVTGPQRSGTTIAAHMIGYDIRELVLDEVNFHHRNIREIPDLLACEGPCVLQCPQALPWMPILTRKDIAVVFMRRPIGDIENSLKHSKTPKGKPVSLPWFSPEQAYLLWSKIKPLLHNPYEVNYESLKEHPLYISPKKRKKGWAHKSIDCTKQRYVRADYTCKET